MTGSVKAMISALRAKRRSFMSGEKFFVIQDLFRLTAKEWAQLLNDLDSLTVEERYAVLHGRDDEYGYYR